MQQTASSSGRGFGKRGSVTPAAAPKRLLGTPGEGVQETAGGALSLPKWAIGAVAGLFLMALVGMSGAFTGGGFLGGLLGGYLAHKMLGRSTQTATPSAASPSHTQSHTANHTVQRGGFGSSGSFFGGGGG